MNQYPFFKIMIDISLTFC